MHLALFMTRFCDRPFAKNRLLVAALCVLRAAGVARGSASNLESLATEPSGAPKKRL